MDGSNFQELTYNRQSVKDWSHFKIDGQNNIRLYYQPDSPDEKHGFHFVLLHFVSCLGNADDYWTDPNAQLEVEANLYGVARFDGLRHVYSNSCTHEANLDKLKPDGYVYYQNSKVMAKVYEKLSELEELYCSDVIKVPLMD